MGQAGRQRLPPGTPGPQDNETRVVNESPEPRPGWSEGRAAAGEGPALFYRVHVPAGPRAVLLVAHGLGEHSGRYIGLAADLAPHGIAVWAWDHVGHGLSPGQRGHVRSFADLTHGVARARAAAARRFPALPLFLLGQSLGGLVALRALQLHPDAGWSGAILVAPLLRIAQRVPAWQAAAVPLLNRLLPRLPFASGIDAGALSRDATAVAAYRSDPHVHSRVTPRLYTEMLRALRAVAQDAPRLRTPLLFLVPGKDTIVDAAATLAFARGVPGDVTVQPLPAMRHEPLHEVDRHVPVQRIADWVLARAA